MKPSVEQLGSLLALKREERPEEAYWQDFLCEFHQRQREQAVKRSGPTGIINRVTEWVSDLGPARWAYGAGLAYAAITVGYFLAPDVISVRPASTVPVHRIVEPPAPAMPTTPTEQLDHLDLSPSTEGSAGEQIF